MPARSTPDELPPDEVVLPKLPAAVPLPVPLPELLPPPEALEPPPETEAGGAAGAGGRGVGDGVTFCRQTGPSLGVVTEVPGNAVFAQGVTVVTGLTWKSSAYLHEGHEYGTPRVASEMHLGRWSQHSGVLECAETSIGAPGLSQSIGSAGNDTMLLFSVKYIRLHVPICSATAAVVHVAATGAAYLTHFGCWQQAVYFATFFASLCSAVVMVPVLSGTV